MHPRNKLRLLAGIPIDASLEITPVKEAREVPNRKDVMPANEANLKKKQESVNKACQHLRNAVKALEAAPATDTSADIPQMIKEIEELCADLEHMSNGIGEVKPIKESHVDADKDTMVKDKSGKSWKVLGSGKGEGPDEEYQLECPKSGKKVTKKASDLLDESMDIEDTKPTTSQQFKDGDVVLYDDGIYVVVLSDAQADMVGIIPAGMANASAEEKNRSVEMVKPDKVRKPTEEEMSVMKQSPERRASIDDDMAAQFSMEGAIQAEANLRELWDLKKAEKSGMRYKAKSGGQARGQIAKAAKKKEEECEMLESTLNYVGHQVSHENTDSDPINVVGQGEKQWANSLDPKTVKSEIPTQLDQRGDASMDDYETKIKVPSKIKSELRDAIAVFRRDAEKQGAGHTGTEIKQMYSDTADAFEKLLGHLEKGTLQELKKAQIFAQTLMGPMLHKIPDNVWDFIANGGSKRSLKDYMTKIGR